MVVYIAGAISSRMDTYKDAFAKAEKKMRAIGHVVWNPANNPVGLDYEAYFPVCFAMIDTCDAVYMLAGYKESIGAMRELEYAMAKGKHIIYEPEVFTNNCTLSDLWIKAM